MRRPLWAVAVLVLAALSLGAGAPRYRVDRHIRLGGEGFWDYITFDPATRRLFVSHGTHVQVVDARTDSLVGDIPDTPGVHGVALAPEAGVGFTSNGRDSSVTVFDAKTLAIKTRIKLQQRNPDRSEEHT